MEKFEKRTQDSCVPTRYCVTAHLTLSALYQLRLFLIEQTRPYLFYMIESEGA